MNFMSKIQHLCYNVIWRRHTESMISWEKKHGVHGKKIKLRRAKRRAANKIRKKTPPGRSPTHIVALPCHSTKIYDSRNRFDDRLRIHYYQCQRTNDQFVPRWIILTTSNYLHAGGWTGLLR